MFDLERGSLTNLPGHLGADVSDIGWPRFTALGRANHGKDRLLSTQSTWTLQQHQLLFSPSVATDTSNLACCNVNAHARSLL